MPEAWTIKGDLVLSCNCTVFCPCVLSLGQHPPTEGYCQTWAGIRIDEGQSGETDLSGIKAGLIIDIPGQLSRGNWTAALFIDEDASIQAVRALTRILTGRAGGSTGLLKILVGSFLGVRQTRITYRVEGDTRIFEIPKIIEGAVYAGARQAAGRERRHPQQRVLDRARDHRGACRDLARAGVRPQLELRRPLGRAVSPRLER